MSDAAAPQPVLVEIWRGAFLECVHRGSAVAVDAAGEVVAAWGDPDAVFLPRSSLKPLQALPLVEGGAADAAGLGDAEIALATASHAGMPIHVDPIRAWLSAIGMREGALLCGAHKPNDAGARAALRDRGARPSALHNNCSGKHAGFLTLARHLGAAPEGYLDPDAPVQRAVRAAIEEMTGAPAEGHAIDGCSAPNFGVTLKGLATGMARLARPDGQGSSRARAAMRIVAAMAAHAPLVSGPGRAATRLIEAARGAAVVKSGAEGSYAAILPGLGLGLAVKIEDGGERGSEAAIAALLARFGVLDRADPAFIDHADTPIINHRGILCGRVRAADTLFT